MCINKGLSPIWMFVSQHLSCIVSSPLMLKNSFYTLSCNTYADIHISLLLDSHHSTCCIHHLKQYLGDIDWACILKMLYFEPLQVSTESICVLQLLIIRKSTSWPTKLGNNKKCTSTWEWCAKGNNLILYICILHHPSISKHKEPL